MGVLVYDIGDIIYAIWDERCVGFVISKQYLTAIVYHY